MLNSKYFAHITAIFTVIIWGSTFISTKVLLDTFTPIEILFIRFCIGLIALYIIQPKRMQIKDKRHNLYFIGAGLSGVTLYFLFENIALTYSLASNIGVIVSTAPFFTAILAHILIKDAKIHRNFMLGFIIAILGIFLISFNGSSALTVNPIGDILAILAAIVWAFYSIIMKRISTFEYTTIQSTRRIFSFGILFMIPFLFFLDFHITPDKFSDPIMVLNLLYLGFGASAVCFVSWNYTIKVLGALRSSAYIYLVPVVTVAFSAIILNEPLTWSIVVGTICTLLGLYLSEKKATPAKENIILEEEKV
ncbi:drug/metabolite transporter (DMT)-like permease [Breznakia sp. PF5-3]|uniref:DMT family transporter n=1 Tax=unclassified Breznakia TaxID=2623764 RepID=UPI002406327C|nr:MULTISPECIES: DMT family transporter [unclassified Breznakia]MDF9824864.1 drug/metabolite transporter (DMT)-like permease [Breznakia sp. PM6-1]MDF9835721.1 drug/metabolite transporter (DMT)-like permease [Breznakia sp. PF5-3]MDF9838281.1 drug/metabolite transporter (DMT)-like permease [Breznakia sp. PFB2-8]MDF9860280.1 drug/metabolite transporter (DMT)-like permease [Breznakia sp. PH5-24]